MATDELIMAIDQGTTSSRAILFNPAGDIVAVSAEPFRQIFPHPGWVEHDLEEIWQTTLKSCRAAIAKVENGAARIKAIGITNQRETTALWDRATQCAIHNAIVWQDRRTAATCDMLRAAGHEALVESRTGLLLDPYFSATKIAWLLREVEGAAALARAGRLCFGTIDSFLLSRLTGVHATDASNASRTQLYDIEQGKWDAELCALFEVPMNILPEVRDSVGDFGLTDPQWFGRAIPVTAILGDQQAAAVGQACFSPGMVKVTYGTGCFMLALTGAQRPRSRHRLLSTVAWQLGGKRTYALEGSIFVAGAAVQWLRDGLGLVASAAETEALARSIPSTGGVYLVPAFAGLGAPYWRAQARGALVGLTRGSGRAEIARAALEAMAYQTHDLLAAMRADGAAIERLRVDGGMTANDWMVGDIANILALPIDRPKVIETTALGVAMFAGLGAGLYRDLEELAAIWRLDRSFHPDMDKVTRDARLAGWRRAVAAVEANADDERGMGE